MNWLRDNILKILIILGVAIIAIVIVAIVITPKSEDVVSGSKYGEIETKLQNAAIKYTKKNKKKLPTSTEDSTVVNLSTLQANNYIGNLVAVDDLNTKCDGYVEIDKIKEDKAEYRYTPYITCGKYYTTKTIGDYIIDVETNDGEFNRTTDAGLYKIGDEYVFRGENVNNYIKLDSHSYRIIKIDSNKSLQLISMGKTEEDYIWDDRYNIEKDTDDGINDFLKSRLKDSLKEIYENSKNESGDNFFSETEKDYIIPHDYCIGKRYLNDTNIYSGTECKQTASLNVGLISLNEYSRASIDPNCVSIYDKSCANYNYFNVLSNSSSYTYVTLTAVQDNTYEFYRIKYNEVQTARTSYSNQLYPVVYINSKTIFASGTGTKADPYIVR